MFISILTATWNRSKYLWSVHVGLAAQSNCSVTYIRADRHVCKVRMDNEAVRQAKEEFILWCDSDDWLLPNACIPYRWLSSFHTLPHMRWP
jgi:glycosyltransferase involved in cell wall biosynthesis